jgi:hypothetical protein
MAHFKNKKGDIVKFPRKKSESTSTPTNKKNFKPADKKFKFVNVNIKLAYQDFYGEILDSLYNILSTIPFDKVAVVVKMVKPDNPKPIAVGEIVKFNNDNSITVRVTEGTAKHITDKHVVSVKCNKDYKNNEITRANEFIITDRFCSVDEHYADIEKAFSESEAETETEVDVETEVEAEDVINDEEAAQ